MSENRFNRPPPAMGLRIQWDALPERVKAAVGAKLGGPVARAENQTGGFSPGVAARVRTRGGTRAFIKAASPSPNPSSPPMHRREVMIASVFSSRVPAPRFLWSLDDGEEGWIVLAFEDIDGRTPLQPWDAGELGRVLDDVVRLSESLTPSPLDISLAGTAVEGLFGRKYWGRCMSEGLPAGLDAWSRRHIETLAALENEAVEAVTGQTLVHFDVRADNVMLTADKVYFVDWAHARVGAAWLDMALMAPSVEMQGGMDAEEMLMRHPEARRADPRALNAAIAALAGFFTVESLGPPPPGLPTLRAFQAAQGKATREWLAGRTGLD